MWSGRVINRDTALQSINVGGLVRSSIETRLGSRTRLWVAEISSETNEVPKNVVVAHCVNDSDVVRRNDESLNPLRQSVWSESSSGHVLSHWCFFLK
jgi:hypothetical protein